jgi:hypothetical protein
VYSAELSDIEIPRGSKARFFLVYPEVASGRRITELRLDIYSFQGWTRSFLERCTLSFEQRKSGQKDIEEKPVETAIPDSSLEIMDKPEGNLDKEHLDQNLEGLLTARCLVCGKPLPESDRRFCSTNCLITYNKRGRREKVRATPKTEGDLDEERLNQGLIKFFDAFGNPKWGTVEETTEAMMPRLREYTQGREIEWSDVSAFLSTQEVTFHYPQTKIRLINALYSEMTRQDWPQSDRSELPVETEYEVEGELGIEDRRCPECGGKRLIRHGEQNELFCMDCCFVIRSR